MGTYQNGFYVFAQVTSDDRAGLLWVVTLLSLIYASLTLIVRVHIKKRTIGADDWFIGAATIIGLAQYGTIFAALENYGLGKATDLLSYNDAVSAGRAILASNSLALIANALSKASIIFFMKRLFSRDNKTAWLCCNILLGMIALWTVASLCILTIGCGASTKLLGQRCSGQVLRWGIITSFDSLFEVAVTVLSVVLVLPLQMSTSIKISVVFAFSFRIVVAVFACIRVYYLARYTESERPGIAIVYSLIWQQIELGYCLMAATIPTLRSFFRGYEKAMGFESSYYKASGAAKSHNMDTLQRSRFDGDEELELGPVTTYPLRPDQSDYKAQIYGPDSPHDTGAPRRMKSSGSGDSRDPIIRKDVEFVISSENVRH